MAAGETAACAGGAAAGAPAGALSGAGAWAADPEVPPPSSVFLSLRRRPLNHVCSREGQGTSAKREGGGANHSLEGDGIERRTHPSKPTCTGRRL